MQSLGLVVEAYDQSIQQANINPEPSSTLWIQSRNVQLNVAHHQRNGSLAKQHNNNNSA